jgi:exonuclease-1
MERFLGLCVLSGCDFLHNVPGIGIRKAHALVVKHGTVATTIAVMHGRGFHSSIFQVI